jgi:hypothetical protein
MNSTVYSKLREKKAEGIVNEIFAFVNNTFPDQLNKSENAQLVSVAVQEFISKMTAEYAKVFSVQFTNCSSAYFDIVDAFESIVCKSLYYHLFNALGEDKRLDKAYRKYSFVNARHLGLDVIIDEFELITQLKCK